MAAKNKVTVSAQPTKQRPSSAHRRAAQIAISTEQAELKREAAERRAKRELNSNASAASGPQQAATVRRRAF